MVLLGHVPASQITNQHARKIPNLKKKREKKKRIQLGNLPSKHKPQPKADLEVNPCKIFCSQKFTEVKKLKGEKKQETLGERDQNIRLRKQSAANLGNFSALSCYLLGLLLILEYGKFHQYAFYALNITSITLLYLSGFYLLQCQKLKYQMLSLLNIFKIFI